ncbi:MAG TPA: hypothetical protein VKG26_16170 [Bacteroidia bacterium]|nr:hypothetical protein [Bacteroidia bacterium]
MSHLLNIKLNAYTDNYIHLEDTDNISYWLKKLRISKETLYDAILYTGSTNIGQLKLYLKKAKKARNYIYTNA